MSKRPADAAALRGLRALVRAAAVTAVLAALAAAAAGVRAAELADLELEQLREIVVTTVSRREETLDRAAAAVTVITGDDIRRAGATTLPDALRLAPQLNVALGSAGQVAISARGFNSPLANKMLVLIDGRTVYTPLFSGVWWEAQDVLLDDVERIEVVSGPATALWGSNAVNGLIHIVTRAAAQTPGLLASVDLGTEGRRAALRHGMALGRETHLRVYVQARDQRASRTADARSLRDESDRLQAGFRLDAAVGRDRWSVQGEAYRASFGQPSPGPRRINGAHLLGRWERQPDAGMQTLVQLVLDHTERMHPQVFSERLDTVDLVAQLAGPAGGRHRWVLGAGWRHADDRTTHGPSLAFEPPERRLNWTRLFAQDQVRLGEGTQLTLAGSLERNPYTGTEVLPSLRLSHQRGGQLWWGSLSRAVRAPARIDRELFQPAAPPYLVAGGPDFRAEVSNVLELGWRGQLGPRLSQALTLFAAEHRRQRSVGLVDGRREVRNDIGGRSHGLELQLQWRPVDRWRLQLGAVGLRQRLRVDPGALDFGGLAALGNDPRHWWTLRSSLDLGAHQWDLSVRRVGALASPAVPAYTAVDTRWAWTPRARLELALVLRNLFDPGHPEWGFGSGRAELQRAAMLQLRWQP